MPSEKTRKHIPHNQIAERNTHQQRKKIPRRHQKRNVLEMERQTNNKHRGSKLRNTTKKMYTANDPTGKGPNFRVDSQIKGINVEESPTQENKNPKLVGQKTKSTPTTQNQAGLKVGTW